MPGGILLPYQNRLRNPGQEKPNGIPKIDWGHPMARGLVGYWFDTGLGFYLDLVNGSMSIPGTGAGIVRSPVGPSPYGTGFRNAVAVNCQTDPNNFIVQNFVAPYSFACAFYQISADTNNSTGTGMFNPGDASNNNAWYFYRNQGAFIAYGVGNTTQGTHPLATDPAVNNYYTLVGTATATTSSTVWGFGTDRAPVTGTDAPTTTTWNGSNQKVTFNAFGPTDTGTGGPRMFFWGAYWARTLNAEEAKLLHVDPYCFLVPQEAEMQVIRVPSVAPAALAAPAVLALADIGMKPYSMRGVQPVTAVLPPPVVTVVTTAGNTLPLMGVG